MKNLFTLMTLLICTIVIAQDKIYVHTATAGNSELNWTYIDHPDLNNNPNAGLVYCHVWNPSGSVGIYNNNVTGLWYDSVEEKWGIFNEDFNVDIVIGSSYNVYISNPDYVINHISAATNQGSFGGHTTVIDDPMLNGFNPGPYAILSNYWNPNSVYNNYNYGFYYDVALDKRAIYQEGGMPIPVGAAFKILVDGTGAGIERFTHIVTAENIEFNFTLIDNPSLNNNPDATFVFSHFWGLEGPSSEVDLDKVLGIWYSGTNWSIYTEDEVEPIPIGMAFDIIVAPNKLLGVKDVIPEANISVSPNPTTDYVTISTKDAISNITLYNNMGREILYLEGEGNSMQIDLSNYSMGTYMAKVRVGDAEKTLKLIKQ